MGLREVKAELVKLDKDTLIKHIAALYKKYKPVKEYFDFHVDPDEMKILALYKDRVREGFFPKRGERIRLSISKKAITDFKKIGVSSESLADLMLYYVECAVELTNEYGDIDEKFYSSAENTYEDAIRLMAKHSILDPFKDRALAIVNESSGIGWGFHDYLGEVYFDSFE